MRYLIDAHMRISSEFSFKEETLNFKVIDGKLGDRQLWLAEAASLTEGFTYFSCVHFTIYIGNIIGSYSTQLDRVFQSYRNQ